MFSIIIFEKGRSINEKIKTTLKYTIEGNMLFIEFLNSLLLVFLYTDDCPNLEIIKTTINPVLLILGVFNVECWKWGGKIILDEIFSRKINDISILKEYYLLKTFSIAIIKSFPSNGFLI